jgi:hypothetical protein
MDETCPLCTGGRGGGVATAYSRELDPESGFEPRRVHKKWHLCRPPGAALGLGGPDEARGLQALGVPAHTLRRDAFAGTPGIDDVLDSGEVDGSLDVLRRDEVHFQGEALDRQRVVRPHLLLPDPEPTKAEGRPGLLQHLIRTRAVC